LKRKPQLIEHRGDMHAGVVELTGSVRRIWRVGSISLVVVVVLKWCGLAMNSYKSRMRRQK